MTDRRQDQLSDHLFGMAAVELQLMSGAQVGECLMLQSQAHLPAPLSHVCVEHGYLSPDAANRALAYQQGLQRRLQAESSLFGRVALSLQLLTREQLTECVARQQKGGYGRKLGEVAVELGFLRDGDVRKILAQQDQLKRRMAAEIPLFGRIAMDLGMLTSGQLQECIELQSQEGSVRRIGEVCVERGYLAVEQVREILQRQKERGAAPSNNAREAPAAASASSRHAASSSADAPMLPSTQSPTVSGGGEPQVNRLLRQMVSLGASDLHLSSDCLPHIRVDGAMRAAGRAPISDAELRPILMEIVTAGPRADFEEKWDADFAHEIEGVARFRVNLFCDRKGAGAVFRQIPYEIVSPEKLGLPPQVMDMCWLSKGLVLVTGPTGSGKSTTLATLIDFINRNRTDHIVTIEDPIEFVHQNRKCLVNQREVGTHTKSFKNALRAALREDPDIVLVGELRDLETVAIAIETAETGHLVFGTLHTTTAMSTVDRVVEQFPGNQQEQIRTMLADSLRGVVAQMLCKRIGGGRVAAFEILIGTAGVANLIREGKTEQLISMMQMGRKFGMQTMNEHFLELVRAGIVEPGEAYIKSNDKRGLKEHFDKLGIELPPEMVTDMQKLG